MKRVTLIQVGIGTVGGAVIEQVLAHRNHWRQSLGLEVTVGAVVGRAGAVVDASPDGLAEAVLRSAVEGRRSGLRVGDVADARGTEVIPAAEAVAELAAERPTILLDAGAGDETIVLDARALAMGAGVVLSNKAPLALPLSHPLAAALWEATGPGGHVRYEATCGAGLPVISTLRALLDTGDEVVEIQGALSGTLGAIFSDVAAGQPFSVAVRGAKDRGYTEPDPRDDLSGLDVARKALILARTIGRRIDLDEINVESLVPGALADVDVPAFLDRVGELDATIAEREQTAQANDGSLKYVATMGADGPVSVGARAIPASGVLGTLQGPENVISFRTRRYDAYPLTVVGP